MIIVNRSSLLAEEKQNTMQSNAKNTWQEIVKLLNNKREDDAFQLALEHQDENDPKLWCYLGLCYMHDGKHYNADIPKALQYFHQAEKYIPFAKYQIGLIYAFGDGIGRDQDVAWKWLSEAVDCGYQLSENDKKNLLELLFTPLTEYSDSQLKLRFPGQEFNLKFLQRYIPKQTLGYSLRYDLIVGKLDLYVYNKNNKPIPDGVSSLTQDELKEAENTVLYLQKIGSYQNVRNQSEINLGQLKTSGLHYAWYSFVYDQGEVTNWQSITLIFGAFRQFFKLRYSGKAFFSSENDENTKKKIQLLPKEIINFLNQLDSEIAKTMK